MYHVYIYIYINLHKYNLFCLYNITCVYVFRTGHLALNKQLFFSPPEKTVSLALSKSQRVRDFAGRLSIAMISEVCWFFISLTQPRHIWEKGIIIEKTPPQDWPVFIFVGNFLDNI